MNKKQKEVELAKLTDEEKELKHLKAIYNKAADDITNKLKISNGKINVLLSRFDELDDTEKSILQSQIYQRNFQNSLKSQIDGFLKDLESKQYDSIDSYLKDCYETGFIGTMYDLHGQGIPLIMPIDQKQVAAAIKLDPKISKNLYTKLGEDVAFLKKRIANNVSRGIATASEYKVIARNIAADSNVGFNRAMRIARTEGHGVQVQAAVDVQHKAKAAGADIVKQWDAALDGRTRDSHRMVDGEIRELDEKFSNNMMYPSDPAGGAAEVINCRCALLQRAKWALDEDELQTLKDRAAYFGLDKTKDFEDFKKKYLKAAEEVKSMPAGFIPAKTIDEAQQYAEKLGVKYAVYDNLPIETANELSKAVECLPAEARPIFVGDSKTLELYYGGSTYKLPRKHKQFYGVTLEDAGELYLGFGKGYDFDTHGSMVAISASYKTPAKITKAKLEEQARYKAKYGVDEFFNTDGKATIHHEMGHVYQNKYGLPKGFEEDAKRWSQETGIKILEKPSEAFSEAWGAYYSGTNELPAYIAKYFEGMTAKKVVENSVKSSTITVSGKDLSKYVGQSIVETDNQSVREWYVANVKNILNQLDKTKPLEDQARQVYDLRTKYKKQAREAMSDASARQDLEKKRPVKTFEELMKDKMERKGMTRKEALEDIIKTSSTTNEKVNEEFGLKE